MISFSEGLLDRARGIVEQATAKGVMIATAESCTGGLVAALLTEVAGSSAVVDRGFVTYSNEAKTALLAVPTDLIGRVGAVSEPVARAMAEGALAGSQARIAVSITGIAGPGGGSAEKPVGLVHFACAATGRPTHAAEHRFGDRGRAAIRAASVAVALDLLEETLGQVEAPRP